MRHETIHLKDIYPFLGEEARDPVMKLYLPYNMAAMNRQDQKRPGILLCPGGGYSFCSEREDEPIGLHFLPEGYNVFILTYSTSPHRFPVQLREVAAAMELIYQNADAWNCDTGRIAIMGFSAGGHLAAHYSTCFDCAEVREVFPESKAVNASILCYPVITADPAHSHKGSFKNLTGIAEMTEEQINKFSCDRQVSEHTPPAFVWHTASDATVPVMNSLLYTAALTKRGIPAELHIYPYGKHGLSTVDGQTNNELDAHSAHAAQWLSAVKNWLKVIF